MKKASALDPENLEFKLKLARIYSKKGFKKAIEELLKLKNENPDFHEARVALGVLYFGIGNVLEAQAEWEKYWLKTLKMQDALTYLGAFKNASEVSVRKFL